MLFWEKISLRLNLDYEIMVIRGRCFFGGLELGDIFSKKVDFLYNDI